MNRRVLSRIEAALKSVAVNVYHFDAGPSPMPYIVWSEDGAGEAVYANGRVVNRVLTGSIDYFTKCSEDPKVQNIEKCLADAEIAWVLNSVQYEDNRRVFHYEWVWEVPDA